MSDTDSDFVHLARLTLAGKHHDASALVRRALPPILRRRPDLAAAASEVLREVTTGVGLRGRSAVTQVAPLPVDNDSRLELLRREYPASVGAIPVWPAEVGTHLTMIVDERRKVEDLVAAGVEPTRSALLVGPPGVGKTLAARWVAEQLSLPLLILDLAAVMSSYLGRTGNNIRAVIEYAHSGPPSVLLLDEFDAIAKRRDDAADVGELKRLVNVLLQAVDDWPSSGLLLAATNHPELLDPAVWRRFDRIIEFPLPGAADIGRLIDQHVTTTEASDETRRLLRDAFAGSSFAEIERDLNRARRNAVVRGESAKSELQRLAFQLLHAAPRARRLALARQLHQRGVSQREIQRLTRIARDTLRKRVFASKE